MPDGRLSITLPVAEPYARGMCEAGHVTFAPFERTHDDDRRARWLAGGVLLCGSCKRKAVDDGRIRV